MTPEGFALALRAFTIRRPFRPFFIELHSGTRLLVRHPEAVQFRGFVEPGPPPGRAFALIHFVSPGEETKNHVFDHDSDSMLLDPPDEPKAAAAPEE
jgi:hypothetical protein